MKPVMMKELSEVVMAKIAKEKEGNVSRPTKKRQNNAVVPTVLVDATGSMWGLWDSVHVPGA
jgi:hypothetical protein